MKQLVTALILFSFFPSEIKPQVVIGKLVDENISALAEVQLQLYIFPDVYNATSDSDGTFIFDIPVIVQDNQLPTGYSVSDNYPNPFNPKTRIAITLPSRKNVKVEVFNLLGQMVTDVSEQDYNSGTSYIDIELNGVPNGFYISRITIDNKYTVVKKLMLIYGSQHLITSGGSINVQLPRNNNAKLETNLDSLVASSMIIGMKTFTGLPSLIGDTLDLGNLIIERFCLGTPTVTYEGKIYHTVRIGDQCWLKESLDLGIMIQGNLEQTDNGVIEKYCYNNDIINCNIYGGLYQWNEAMQYVINPGVQGICPQGWHLPTLEDFQTLYYAVSGNGNSLKSIGQGIGGGAGTNISGFSALLGGDRSPDGYFFNFGVFVFFWSSTEYTGYDTAYNLSLNAGDAGIPLVNQPKQYGFCIRCIKD